MNLAYLLAAAIRGGHRGLWAIPAVLLLSTIFGGTNDAAEPAESETWSAEQLQFFETQVRPVLADNCYECHSARADKVQAGLLVDSRAALLRGGDSGPAIVPGEPAESLLIEAIRYESFEMPPDRRLSNEIIDTLVRWIELGAPWPAEAAPPATAAGTGPATPLTAGDHWCWRPVRPVTPPQPDDASWAANSVDQFVLARLEHLGLKPAGDADRQTLVRRLYFDLIGLPPTLDELHRWQQHPADSWYEALVDELLDSPHFGEKWARHWMDLVRYAETCGHEFDYPIHQAYQYRDYLIRAFNQDVPYDQFVQEHIAGDLLPQPRRHPTQQFNESVIGTGFWFLGESVHAPTDVRGDEALRVDNQIDVMGKTFLGLTVACARCHHHKFDPISTEDYYALAGFLQSSRRQFALLDPGRQIAQKLSEMDRWQRVFADTMPAHVAGLPDGSRLAQQLLIFGELYSRSRDQQQKHADERLEQARQDLSSRLGVAPESLPDNDEFRATLAVITSPPVSRIDHPLYFFRKWLEHSSQAGTEPPSAADTAQLLQSLRQEPSGARPDSLSEEDFPLFTNFSSSHFADEGWSATGQAFGDGPTQQPSWQWSEGQPRVLPSHVATSHRDGHRPQGVLRSPTFTLRHDRIHYRVRAQNAQIRLIVDGYFMDEFNALLFGECTLKNVNTHGEFQWVTQHRDLSHYLGHRAHLEIIDDGDGYVEVDQIRFSSSRQPPVVAHPWNVQLAASVTPEMSLGEMTGVLGGLWQSTRETLARQPLSAAPLSDAAAFNALAATPLLKRQDERSWTRLLGEYDALQAAMPTAMQVLAITDGTGENERVHIRGSHTNLGNMVPRRNLDVLGGESFGKLEGSGRLQFAQRLTSPENPLVSRVIVNRVWHHLFGRGIVASVDDFGIMGQAPTHPLLLDHLAHDLMQEGWSLKRLIRQLVMSRTYRLASRHDDPRVRELDPTNQYLSHASVRRLSAEAIRDAVLTVSGQLDRQQFGPSVPVHLTPFMTGRGRPRSGPLDGGGRRSIYIAIRRNFLPPMMLSFDMPIPFNTMGRRSASNVPSQSLMMMNDPFIHDQAEKWASRLREVPSPAARLTRAYQQAFARRPAADEVAAMQGFLAQQAELRGAAIDSSAVWTDFCHALMNLKEFIYLH